MKDNDAPYTQHLDTMEEKVKALPSDTLALYEARIAFKGLKTGSCKIPEPAYNTKKLESILK